MTTRKLMTTLLASVAMASAAQSLPENELSDIKGL